MRIKRIVFFDESQIVYNGKSFRYYWESLYGNDHRFLFFKSKARILARVAFLKGGFRPDEFYLYDLENQGIKDYDHYLSQKRKDRLLSSYYGSNCRAVLNLLKDKFVFYSYLKGFFKRDIIYIKCQEDRSLFLSFCCLHRQIFAKQNKGSCGNSARKLILEDEEQASVVFDELVALGEWIIEELIIQDSSISAYNSSSINTVRFLSFKKNRIVKCVLPCMRFGRAGSIVDNAGQGGVFVSIDQNTGEIITDAFDEKGNCYLSHPDSKIVFRGFRIPQWGSLVEMVKNAHLALPDNQVYVAFDFAFSNKGWCIVEGNWGDLILQQVSLKKGLSKEFVSLLMGDK